MYTVILNIHNLARWIVVLAGLAVAIKSIVGWVQKKEWTPIDNQLGLIFTIGMDIQILLGFILYLFLSPLTKMAFQDFGAAMSDSDLRFFAVEHILMMIIALVLAHVGRVLTKRATTDADKFKKAAILYSLAIIIVFVAIPWYRPLFRLG